MADFSTAATQVTGPQGAGAQALAPVQEQAVNPLGGVLGVLDTAVDLFGSLSAKNKKTTDEAAKQAYLQSYLDEEKQHQDALRTGQLGSGEVLARSRATYSKFYAGNSKYSTDIQKLREGFSKGDEIGEAEDAAKTEKDRLKAGVISAQNDGVDFPPNASPATQQALVSGWQKQVRAKKDMDEEIKRVDYQMRVGNYNEAQAKEVARKASISMLNTIASSQVDNTGAFIADLAEQVSKNPESADNARIAFTSHFAKIESTLTAAASTQPELAASYRSLFAEYKSLGSQLLDPKKATEEVKNQLEKVKAQLQLTALASDPVVGRLYSASALFGQNANLGLTAAAPIKNLIENITNAPGGTSPNSDIISDKTTQKEFVNLLDKSLSQLGSSQFPVDKEPKARSELRVGYENVLDQLGDRLNRGMKPAELEDVMKHLASPKFGKYAEKEGLTPKGLEAVKSAIQTRYNAVVTKSVNQKLEEFVYGPAVFTRGGSNAPTTKVSEVVDVKFYGSGISFTPRMEGLGPQEQADLKERTKALNDAAAGVNRMVQVTAHLEGTTDYAATWEKNKYIFVPQLYPARKGTVVEFSGAKYSFKDLPGVSYQDRSNWQPIK